MTFGVVLGFTCQMPLAPPFAVELPAAGGFWQDEAMTIIALPGDPVWVWQGKTGINGVAPDAASRPVRAASGGVIFDGDSQLLVMQAYVGTALSVYAKCKRQSLATDEFYFNDATFPENSYNYALAFGGSYGRIGNGPGAYGAAWGTSDVVASMVRGPGANNWIAVDNNRTLMTAGGAGGGVGFRLGAYNAAGAFPAVGQMTWFGLSTVSDTYDQWLASVAYGAAQ